MAKIVKRWLATHESGTKFYEVVLLSNGSHSQNVELRRWGRVADIKGGGQSSFQTFPDSASSTASYTKQTAAKTKGGYREIGSVGVPTDDFAQDLSAFSIGGIDSLHELFGRARFQTNYGVVSANVYLRQFEDSYGKPTGVINPGLTPKAEPVPEPVRSGDWGSW